MPVAAISTATMRGGVRSAVVSTCFSTPLAYGGQREDSEGNRGASTSHPLAEHRDRPGHQGRGICGTALHRRHHALQSLPHFIGHAHDFRLPYQFENGVRIHELDVNISSTILPHDHVAGK